MPQGISAELIAAKWGFSRTELDEFSAGSHEKAARATKEGLFDNELAPIAGLSTDEIIRPGTTVETLAGLRPAFYNEAYAERFPQINWEITPGNSSPLSDGSAAVMITSGAVARKLGLKPLARIHTTTVVGSDPLYMLTGVIPATEKVLARAGLTLSDIDLFEVNEAFAPVVLAWANDTGCKRGRSGQDQRQRRRDRDRTPAGRQRCSHHDHAGQRARAARRSVWPADDVRGRRHGQRHHHRAAHLSDFGVLPIALRSGARRTRFMTHS